MQLSTTFSFLALSSIAAAASSFGLISIRSGSNYQYLSVNAGGDILTLGGDGLNFFLNDDGTLQVDGTDKWVYVDKNNFYATGESDSRAKGFGTKNGYLTYNDKSFNVCPDGSKYPLSTNTCSNGSPVALKVVDEKILPLYTNSILVTSSTPVPEPTKPAPTKPETTKPAPTKPAPVPVPDKKILFGVVSVRSGTKFQNAPIKKVQSHLHVFSVGGTEGSDVSLTLLTDGSLVDQDNVAIFHDPNTGELGNVNPFGTEQPTKGFAIKDGHLVLDGNDNWKACPSGTNQFSLANNDCTGGTGIVLHVLDPKDL